MTENIEDLVTEAGDVGDKRRKSWPTPREMSALIRRLSTALKAEHKRAEELSSVRWTADQMAKVTAERDELRAVVHELRAGLDRFQAITYYAEAREILSRIPEYDDKEAQNV